MKRRKDKREETEKEGKKLFRIFSLIGNILFIPVITLMIAICFFLLAARSNNKLPTVFDNLVVRVLSGSMEPEYHKGDLVIVRKVASSDLQKGDVIAFYRYTESEAPSAIWFHRIVDIGRNEDGYLVFQTKGDANSLPDTNWTREDYVIGKYNENAAFLHEVLAFANSRKGIAILIIIPSSIIFLYEGVVLINLIDERIRKKEKRKLLVPSPSLQSGIQAVSIPHYDQEGIIPTNAEPERIMDSSEKFKYLSRKEPVLDEILQKIEVLKQKKKATVRKIMKEAVKLEKIRRQCKSDSEENDKILDALNWCYETIGKVRYEKQNLNLEKGEKK